MKVKQLISTLADILVEHGDMPVTLQKGLLHIEPTFEVMEFESELITDPPDFAVVIKSKKDASQ